MKIAFLSFYSGYIYRGVETFVHELAEGLARNHEVTVFSGGPHREKATYQQKQVLVQEFDDRPFYQTDNLRTLILGKSGKIIKKFTEQVIAQFVDNFDVVIPLNGGWQTILCRLWCLQHGRKILLPGQFGTANREVLNLFSCPSCYVSMSNSHLDWAKKWLPFLNVAVIPNGVDTNLFSPNSSPASLNLSHPIVICVAATESNKRIDLAIRAISKLNRVSLLVMGDGHQKNKYLKLGEELLPGRFKIIKANHHEMPKFYRASDLITLPSRHEGMPLSLLEAMACGLPVVTVSHDQTRREMVEKAGLFVNPEVTDKYAQLLDECLKKDWGQIPREQAEKYSWDKVIKRWESLIATL